MDDNKLKPNTNYLFFEIPRITIKTNIDGTRFSYSHRPIPFNRDYPIYHIDSSLRLVEIVDSHLWSLLYG